MPSHTPKGCASRKRPRLNKPDLLWPSTFALTASPALQIVSKSRSGFIFGTVGRREETQPACHGLGQAGRAERAANHTCSRFSPRSALPTLPQGHAATESHGRICVSCWIFFLCLILVGSIARSWIAMRGNGTRETTHTCRATCV